MMALILLMIALVMLTVGLVIYAIYAPSMPSPLDQRYQQAKSELAEMERAGTEENVNDCDFGNDPHCQALASALQLPAEHVNSDLRNTDFSTTQPTVHSEASDT